MKKSFLLVLCLISMSTVFAQTSHWVFFTDKGLNTAEQLHNPTEYLSADALARRAELGIPLSVNDLPVLAEYKAAISQRGFSIKSSSRWLNAVVIDATAPQLQALRQLPFVAGTRKTATLTSQRTTAPTEVSESVRMDDPLEYGDAAVQNNMLNLAPLHERGITGKGVKIAVLDAGFPGVDTLSALKHIFENDRMIATYDFVEDTNFVFHANSHGTEVLSTIASYLPGQIIGTAPEASFVLCRTEYAPTETQVEEYNFMEAVEFADSIGVDIIHASLGYTEFDEGIGSYTYEDLNGDKAITTRAVDFAASKGIIVTISAGNEGASTWRHIAVPCDADSILCVGAVDRYTQISYFSSVGPTADGRIKPDVVAMGTAAAVVAPNGRITRANGTSFSGPIMAGFSACMRQAHPDRSNMDIIQAIRLSGDQAGLPDNEYGYGVPNAVMADSLLANVSDLSSVKIDMAEKPQRGRQEEVSMSAPAEKEEVAEIVFTENPKTALTRKGKKVVFSTAATESTIVEWSLFKGTQQVTVDAKDIKLSTYGVTLKTKYLLPGEYYLKVETADFTEYLPFTLE